MELFSFYYHRYALLYLYKIIIIVKFDFLSNFTVNALEVSKKVI